MEGVETKRSKLLQSCAHPSEGPIWEEHALAADPAEATLLDVCCSGVR